MTTETIRHQDSGRLVVVAKLLTRYLSVTKKVSDPAGFVTQHQYFDAGFVAHVLSWQENHSLTADGVIGPDTWASIAKEAPTCSTSKNRISAPTLAAQMLLDTNITCDAIYGSRTKNAVSVWQASKGLKADGICGPKTWAKLLAEPSEDDTCADYCTIFIQPPDFKQYDSRWAKKRYSTHTDAQTMANSGCGPTAMADVVAALKDPGVTPYDLAQLSMAWGDRTYDSGTAWTFFQHIMTEYNFTKMVQSASIDALKACLDAGGYVVCSMGPGYWTKSGHFITAWKYDANYIYCNDPASDSRKQQAIKDFTAQRKQFFCFYPDVETVPASTARHDSNEPIPRGKKICDISKYQAHVDYDALVGDTALIILRAGYRGTLGGIKQDECFRQHAEALRARGVRFGVYFYSIAGTVSRAREEAQKFFEYASPSDPLFYAMDAEKPEISAEAIAAFADELKKQGVREGCYVAHHLYSQYGYDGVRECEDFTWIPRYGSTRPKYDCDLWQYTSTGSVAGISGNVDLNRITGTGKALEWFLGGGER